MITMDDLTEIVGNTIGTIFGSRSGKILKKIGPRVDRINSMEPRFAKLSDAELRALTEKFREAIADLRAKDPKADESGKVEKYLDSILEEAFALVREAGKRTLGMRHFDVQLVGGMVLHNGMISEMVTGEGKTLVATLPSYLNALPRRPHEYAYVHVVTVNDYLARRDSEWNRPLFELLGLSCGAIQSHMDSWERHPIYARDIVYGTNSEFGFDYLRDNMKPEPERQVQQVRHFAIVDEVDSILIDEARTPLIISGSPDEGEMGRYGQAAQLASHLKPVPQAEIDRIENERLQGVFNEPTQGHYMVDEKDHTVTLTQEGIAECERFLGIENFYTGQHMDWPHFIDNALKAKELYKKGDHYEVAEGREGKREVIIVDEFTGRLMYGRRWSDGLHQAVEAKEIMAGEGIEMEAESQTLATITIQNYFKLFKKLSGMTGTALTEAKEFGKIYKLEVVSIPTNRPMRRENLPDVIYGTEKEKWEAICQEIEKVHATGRPILVGTTSVEKSEKLAGMLERRGLKGKFEVLNAKQHEREAHIVDKAGELGSITVATNMAGRGTDIKLGRFTHAQLIAHWQANDLAPNSFDANRPPQDLESHLIGYWAKHFLDEKEFKDMPQEKRLAALDAWWKANDHPPLRLVESVRDLGGLFILGTERHEARRIDNQLRGRSGRQGDPGSSRFFLSLDDDLMRIFAKDWVRNFLRASGMKDGVPLESRMVSRSIEKAQRRVEEHHFGVRRRLLEYDEVMNEQRKLIYGLRQNVLESKDLKKTMVEWIEDVISMAVEREAAGQTGADSEGVRNLILWAKRKFGIDLPFEQMDGLPAKDLEEFIIKAVTGIYDKRDDELGEIVVPRTQLIHYTTSDLALQGRERFEMVVRKIAELAQVDRRRLVPAPVGPEAGESDREIVVPRDDNAKIYLREDEVLAGRMPSAVISPLRTRKMRLLDRFVMLDTIDTKWKEHLHSMDVLRDGIHLRGYAQKDPKLEYKREGFDLFFEMFKSMKEQGTDLILRLQVSEEVEKQEHTSVWNEEQAQTIHEDAKSAFEGGAAEMAAQSEHGGSDLKAVETIRRTERSVRPNDPCPCGSGKKYKKCCGRMGGGPDDGPSKLMSGPPGKDHKGHAKLGG